MNTRFRLNRISLRQTKRLHTVQRDSLRRDLLDETEAVVTLRSPLIAIAAITPRATPARLAAVAHPDELRSSDPG